MLLIVKDLLGCLYILIQTHITAIIKILQALDNFYGSILLYVIFIPIIGIITLLFVPNAAARQLHSIAFNTAMINFVVSMFL